MLPEIKLVISHNHKVIKTVTKEINGKGFVKSIEDFQEIANAVMTGLIEDCGDTGDCTMEEETDESDNDENNVCVSPKKRKR